MLSSVPEIIDHSFLSLHWLLRFEVPLLTWQSVLLIWIYLPLFHSTNPDTELRKRTVDAAPHSEEMVKPEEEEDENMMSVWKPFLVNICMFTVLTAGAYLCYRVCFH